MYLSRTTSIYTKDCSAETERLGEALEAAEAVVIGAGAGLSAAAGFAYSGERFERSFPDFIEKYGFTDMYSAGFYPFETPEEFWAYWSRYIFINRYGDKENGVYSKLFELVRGREYFVLTTNVDHQFQKAGFEKSRLFYTQGDYGLFQCSVPCRRETYGNETVIRRMAAEQKNMRVPSELIPLCPNCGRPMTLNLRSDGKFVQDEGWYRASERYCGFIRRCENKRVLFLELGVGFNTPAIIKLPFIEMTVANPNAVYACVNKGEALCPNEIASRSICIDADIAAVIGSLLK